METRAQKSRVERIKRKLRFQHVFCVDARGTSGGLALLWNDHYMIQFISSSLNYIHTNVVERRAGLAFDITFIHDNPIFQQRRNLLLRIANLKTSPHGPWCCIGNFNEMLSSGEKDGLRPVDQNGINLFRKFLDDNQFIDLDLKGCKYTWVSNPMDGHVTKQKIDHIVVNWDWLAMFPHAIGIALPIVNSDHSPLLLKPKPPLTSGKQFRYEAFD